MTAAIGAQQAIITSRIPWLTDRQPLLRMSLANNVCSRSVVCLSICADSHLVAYLGTSSNWSFGRRVLVMVHEKLFGLAPPPGRLLFEGQAYDIDWQGAGTANMGVRDETVVLPTSDFALFLINTVKFRCGQLFHLFDEETFMQSFSKFHSSEHPKEPVGALWYAHYLMILALGKALVVIFTSGTKPAGSDLFVEAMRILPDVGLTTTEPIQSMEILCCAALYLQCLDKRKAAYNQVSSKAPYASFRRCTDSMTRLAGHCAPH